MESMDEQSAENNDSCVHLNAIAEDEREVLENTYQLVLSYYVTLSATNAPKRKAEDAYCTICNVANKRLHACLQCAFFGCFDSCDEKNKCHMKDHVEEYEHYFAININRGCLFCFQCDDYIYDENFEEILDYCKIEAIANNDTQTCLSWTPQAEEIARLKNKVIAITTDSNIGLRGIVNIGNSCYINCLIQVFVHNPLMRKFFFSDRHICFKKGPDPCLTCEMYRLFQDFYAGIEIHYNPMKFLSALEKYSSAVFGEQQDDSYLLYQDILKGLLDSCQEYHDPGDCSCTIHEMFYGIIENNIKCSHCGKASLLPDEHFMDILLDLKDKTDTIEKILERQFSNEEELIDYKCSGCNMSNTSSASQIIRKLPSILCFRMNCVSEWLTKKATAFDFEEWVDMSPYLKSRYEMEFTNEYKYCLFGIVYHKGRSLHGGHYCTYVRQFKDRWFECDDTAIYVRTAEQVFRCQPFLLFYYRLF